MPNMHICNTIQQLVDSRETESSVQILNSVIDGRNQKITTVERQQSGGEFGNAMTSWANMAEEQSKANGMISADTCGGGTRLYGWPNTIPMAKSAPGCSR